MSDPKIEKIHEDKRGTIYRFFIDGKERLLIFTKEGYLRGGHMHKEIQQNFVLSGAIEWTEFHGTHDDNKIMQEGESNTVMPFTPHLLTAVTDCWIIENKFSHESAKMCEHYRNSVLKAMGIE